MEQKLEPKDIAGYLPYGLKAMYAPKLTNKEKYTKIVDIHGLNFKKELDDEIILILRPLSDLYKTITHNGKEIVPIVELAKIAFPEFEWNLVNDIAAAADNLFIFIYDERKENQAFTAMNTDLQLPIIINNQYQLFDYMNELKIDYRGLIDAGLAIDCNTLDNNPYC